MKNPLEEKLIIVTGLEEDGKALLEEKTVDELLETLYRRAYRLVKDPTTCKRLEPGLREFVINIVEYFNDSTKLDEYVLMNIMTALATADCYGLGRYDIEDYSTFIRRLNPTDPDTSKYFVIGRAGSLNHSDCPLEEMEGNSDNQAGIPLAQMHMFRAFHYARLKDITRDAPKIPVQDFSDLVPDEIMSDPVLEEAFLDVCFSDGAWDLYQLKLAA